jgi:hypothetical protein
MKQPFHPVFVLYVLASVAACLPEATVAAEAAATTFQSGRKAGQTDRVVVRLEVGGETKFTDAGKPQREKMSVLCDLDYLEKTVEIAADADATWRSVRDYQKVSVDVKVGDGRFKPALEPRHCVIAVEAAKQSALLFSPGGSLTRDELDAIDIQANSLLLDRLLPEQPVAVGDRWEYAPEFLAGLLGLDEVSKSTVQSVLKEVADKVARFEFVGRVEGTVYGVSTAVDVKGRYRYDLRTKRIDWLGMLAKEDRPSSAVDDGVDVVSRLQIMVTPAKEPASLADSALAKLTLKPAPEAAQLTYQSPDGGWQCRHDRRWYVHHQRPKTPSAVLRLVDGGKAAGQCNLASLPDRDPTKLVSLDEFQEDVRRALGKNFGEFVEAGQFASEANYRVYRVAVQGTASEIAMRWIYYLVSDPRGRQVAFTFAVEQNQVDRFADADKPMVQSLRFADRRK